MAWVDKLQVKSEIKSKPRARDSLVRAMGRKKVNKFLHHDQR